jgi:dTDP-4-amino-4,6-dideoxy-D-galactose acyltransferase
MKLEYLSWDSDFFKFNVSAVKIADHTDEVIEDLISNAISSDTKLLYAFTTNPILNDHLINKYNGRLVDKKVVFKKSLQSNNSNTAPEVVEYKSESVSPELKNLAFQSGEYSRFKIDNRLPPQTFERLYTIWIENSVTGKSADKVFIFKVNTEIAGFITLSIKSNYGEIGLIAVNNEFRGMQIGTKLIVHAENYVYKQGGKILKVATQLDNMLACNFYKKNGYEVDTITHVYHFFNTL